MDSAPSLIGREGGESGVEDVEMRISVPLGEPEDEAVAVKVAAEIIGVADIFLLALFDEGAEGDGLGGKTAERTRGGDGLAGGSGGLAGGRRDRLTGGRGGHLINTVELVASLVVFEADGAGVFAPGGAVEAVLVGNEFGGGGDGPACSDLEDVRGLLRQLVAGLGILLFVENGLELVGGRGFHVIDVAFLHGADTVDGYVAAVGAPVDVAAEVV